MSLSNIFDETELPEESSSPPMMMNSGGQNVDMDMNGDFNQVDVPNNQKEEAFPQHYGMDMPNFNNEQQLQEQQQQQFRQNEDNQGSLQVNQPSNLTNGSFRPNQLQGPSSAMATLNEPVPMYSSKFSQQVGNASVPTTGNTAYQAQHEVQQMQNKQQNSFRNQQPGNQEPMAPQSQNIDSHHLHNNSSERSLPDINASAPALGNGMFQPQQEIQQQYSQQPNNAFQNQQSLNQQSLAFQKQQLQQQQQDLRQLQQNQNQKNGSFLNRQQGFTNQNNNSLSTTLQPQNNPNQQTNSFFSNQQSQPNNPQQQQLLQLQQLQQQQQQQQPNNMQNSLNFPGNNSRQLLLQPLQQHPPNNMPVTFNFGNNSQQPQHHQQQQQRKNMNVSYNFQGNDSQLAPRQQSNDVIELLDDDEDNTASSNQTAGTKRQLSAMSNGPAAASYQQRQVNLSKWSLKRPPTKIIPGYSNPEYRQQMAAKAALKERRMNMRQHEPVYVQIPPNFTPTWNSPMPTTIRQHRPSAQMRSFSLSLLNVQEFTITGESLYLDGPRSSVTGLRKVIKDVSRDYGKAVFEREGDDGSGRWKIPLGAYPAFFAYLSNDPMCSVTGIPQEQLKIASLGRARLEKGYPNAIKLINEGVPKGLATALAPFQRGGVDFVIDKEGKAMIADDMGLGKTIQAIACMSVYHDEWPVLVLTPSSARYHWEAEFQQWLCKTSPVNMSKDSKPLPEMQTSGEGGGGDDPNEDAEIMDESKCMPLMDESQIHVLTSSKDQILPTRNTRVVICSYGLAPALVNNRRILPSMFQCAIVDESHMLKNINSKRTSALVPVLHATNRCVLLSGTPALARPAELWPQLKILGGEKNGWWEDEQEFYKNYVRSTKAIRRAELHALLTGTVMIRRLKADILKSMLPKLRERAVVDVSTPELRQEFLECMQCLREGKGILGKLARQHSALGAPEAEDGLALNGIGSAPNSGKPDIELQVSKLKMECAKRLSDGRSVIEQTIMTSASRLGYAEREDLIARMESDMRREVDVYYKEKLHELRGLNEPSDGPGRSRKTVLNHMYTLTAKAKLPLIVDMVQRWLNDPTKGKLCLFAHHIFVLDEVVKQVGLSNAEGSLKRFIRIDGSTTPKFRQQQIKQFQNDPGVRIAVLGITAAGVAVTLTASSTVWFTELFWTPALMIQAEDRCHRIGQNSRVRCLYIVATGTLDDLLWKLLEKKFRDLGEFVEGKEKLNIVVHQTYHGAKELHSLYFTSPTVDDSDDGIIGDDDSDGDSEFLKLEEDLENEIDMLGQEEMTALLPDGEEDEINGDTKVEEIASAPKLPEGTLGSSEAEAILLSDDEDETALAAVAKKNDAPPRKDEGGRIEPAHNPTTGNGAPDVAQPFHNPRIYKLLFEGNTYGMQLLVYKHRLVVSRKLSNRNPKPAVGDILVGVNGSQVPFVNALVEITPKLKKLLATSSVELTFLEVESFSRFFAVKGGASEDAIELLDDD